MAHQTHQRLVGIALLFLFFAAISFASPAANAGTDQTTTVGQNISANGASSTCSGCSITSYNWNFGDNGTASGVSATHSYSSAGSYSVTLTIVANNSEISSDTFTATVQSGDATPPAITHTNITDWTQNTVLSVSATITDNVGVSSATLYYKNSTDGATFSSTSMSSNGNTYSGTIPSSATNGTNISYYISASDGSSNSISYPAGGSSSPLVANLLETDIVAPITTFVSVAGDSSSPYWVTSGASNNAQVLAVGESGMLCRMGPSNTNYSGMTVGYVDCTISGTSANCTDSIVDGNYTRYVACKDSSGNEQTNASTLTVSFGVDSTAPVSLSSITATELSGRVRMRWTPSTDNTSGVSVHKIYRSASCASNYSSIASVGSAVSEYNDTTGASGIDYCYRIYAQDAAGTLASTSPTTAAITFGAPRITALSMSLSSGTLTLSTTTSENATCRYSASNAGFSSMSSEFTTGQNTTAHSVGVSGTSGSIIYYASCADTLGNAMSTANSTNYMFASASTTTGSTGNTGAGGNVAQGQPAPSDSETQTEPAQPAQPAEPNAPAPRETQASIIAPTAVSEGETVTITLVDAVGAPISGANVIVTGPAGNKLEYITDSNGQFRFTALSEGTYSYAVEGVQLTSSAQTSATKSQAATPSVVEQASAPEGAATEGAPSAGWGALFLVGAGLLVVAVLGGAAYLLLSKKGRKGL